MREAVELFFAWLAVWYHWHFRGGKRWFRSLSPEQKKAEYLRAWGVVKEGLQDVPASREFIEAYETADALVQKVTFSK